MGEILLVSWRSTFSDHRKKTSQTDQDDTGEYSYRIMFYLLIPLIDRVQGQYRSAQAIKKVEKTRIHNLWYGPSKRC
jgi:hypothetical protein